MPLAAILGCTENSDVYSYMHIRKYGVFLALKIHIFSKKSLQYSVPNSLASYQTNKIRKGYSDISSATKMKRVDKY